MVVSKSFRVFKKGRNKRQYGFRYIYISLKYDEEEFVILRIYLNLNTTINTIKIDSFSVTLTFSLRRF